MSQAGHAFIKSTLCVGLSLYFGIAAHAQGSITSITTPHPRLWITPTRLTRMKADATNHTTRWQNVLNVADDAVSNTNDDDPDDIVPLGLVYQVTGTQKYATSAIKIMLKNAVASNDLTDDDAYPYRYALPDMAAGLDWCYSAMTPAQRQQVATWMMDRADFVWPDSNPSRIGAWAVDDPADNYYPGFMQTWIAAIASYGDDTKTGTISGSNRPLYHVNLALQKYNNVILPWANGWGKGGMYAESTNYDILSVFRLAILLDGHKTATGQDLMNATTPGSSFLHDSLTYDLHSTVPGLDQFFPLGDQSRESMPELVPYNRMRALVAMAGTNDTNLAAQTKFWLDNINPNISTWSDTVAWEELYYNSASSSQDYRLSQPTDHFVSGPGIEFRRSDWTPTATYFGIWSGPLQQGHQAGDVNGFTIYKNGWLVANANIYSHSGIEQATYDYNNITFGTDPITQDWQIPDDTWPLEAGQALVHDNTAEFSYFAGQAAQAYTLDRPHDGFVTKESQQVATDYTRKFVFISPNTFLVYDRVSLANNFATLSKNWHLHSETPITVNGRNYKFDNGSARLFGQSLLPATGTTVSVTPEFFEDSTPTVATSYRLNAVTKNNTATDRLLNVFQVTPMATTSVTPAVAISATSGNMDGALVNGWVVMMGRSEGITSATYTVTSTTATQHLVVDLVPNTNYAIGIGSSNAVGTTDASGSLRFAAPAGTNTVTLNKQTANTIISLQITAPANVGVGAAFTVVVAAKDQNNNTVTNYNGTIHLTSTDPQAVLPADFVLTGGTKQVSVKLRTIGTWTVSAKDTANASLTATSGNISVGAAAAKLIIAAATTATAGSPLTFTVTAKDASGNTVPNYSGTAHITSTDANAILPTDATLTNGVGTFGITFKTATTVTITATDTVTNTVKGSSGGIVVSAAAASQFAVTAPASTVSGAAFYATVSAKDAYGNLAKSYAGTVHFTSTDPLAVLPANTTLTNGSKQISIKLKTKPSQTISATDASNGSITGTSGSIAVN